MNFSSTARTTLFSALLAVGGFAVITEADNCYKNVTKSCGAAWASNRTCIDGSVAYPCSDVVVEDMQYNDIAAGIEKKDPITPDGFPVSARVRKFACSGEGNTGTCNDLGINQYACIGRQATGDNCATPGGGGEE